MIIDRKYTRIVRTEPMRETEPRVGPKPNTDPVCAPTLTDIDETSRVLVVHSELTPLSGLEPSRAAQVRRRVLIRAYEAGAVVEAIARRILESGDL